MLLNPMNKMFPWHLKLIRDMWIANIRIPFVISEAFWSAWTEVMYPEGAKCK